MWKYDESNRIEISLGKTFRIFCAKHSRISFFTAFGFGGILYVLSSVRFVVFLWWWLWLVFVFVHLVLFLLLVNIVLKHKTCNCSPKHNNYLQNNKNFAHSLDIETYKYVAQHGSRARASVSESRLTEFAFMGIQAYHFHSIIAIAACQSIIIDQSKSMTPTINILIRECVAMRECAAKCRLVWEIFEWKKQYQIPFSFSICYKVTYLSKSKSRELINFRFFFCFLQKVFCCNIVLKCACTTECSCVLCNSLG